MPNNPVKPTKEPRKKKPRVWALWDAKKQEYVGIGRHDVIAVTRRTIKIHGDYIWKELYDQRAK